jgi:hypothetical protein
MEKTEETFSKWLVNADFWGDTTGRILPGREVSGTSAGRVGVPDFQNAPGSIC